MKKFVVLVFSFLLLFLMVFLIGNGAYIGYEEKVVYNINDQTTEELEDELIVAFLMQNIISDIDDFYSEYYSGEIAVYNYEVSVLSLDKEDTKSIIVKVGVTPQVGAHNPLGYDELSYRVDSKGDVTLKNYKHVKTYSVPERFQEFWIKELQ